MGKTHAAYPPEFRARMVELVRAGRDPEDLAREFESSGQAIRNWVRQAERDEGRRSDSLTTSERDELIRLRRENKQFAPGARYLGKGGRLVRGGDRHDSVRVFPVHEGEPGRVPDDNDGPRRSSGSAALIGHLVLVSLSCPPIFLDTDLSDRRQIW